MNDAAMLISSRRRVVWTNDERRLFDRVARFVNAHGDKLSLRCGSPVCTEPTMTVAHDNSHPGGRVLRCGCTDRVLTRAF